MTATTPGQDGAELVVSAPDERVTEPFQKIRLAADDAAGPASAASAASAVPARRTAVRRNEPAGDGEDGRSPGRTMPGASPWQRSHAVWQRAGVDWVNAAATIPPVADLAARPEPEAEPGPGPEPEPGSGFVSEPETETDQPQAVAAPPAPPAPERAAPPAPGPPAAAPAAPARPAKRPSRGGRRRVLPVAAVAVVLAAGAGGYAVLGGGGEEEGGRSARPAPGAVPADALFAVDPAADTDGLVQQLTGVIGEGATLVAIGGETGGPDRARFLVSKDGGRTWRTARVRAAAGGEPPPAELPRRIAGGGGRWVALGGPAVAPPGDAGPTAVWTSTDGLTWTRQRPIAAFGPQDRVFGLARTSIGFVAVGVTGDGDDARGVLWSSPDGAAWQRTDRFSLGEVGNLDRVIASGGTVLVRATVAKKVTRTETKKGKKRKVTKTVEETGHWRSADGGRTWSPVDVPQAQGSYGDFTGLVGGPGGFFATREGKKTTGEKKRRKTSRHTVVWTSPDGAEWTAAGQLQADGYTGLERLAGSPSGLAALVGIGKDGQTVLRSTDGRTWQRAGDVKGPEITGMTALGATTVLAGRRDAEAYLALPGTGEVNLTAVPGAVRTERAITALVPDGARLLAVGSTNGAPAAWTGPDARAWRRGTGLTEDADPQVRRWLTDAVRGGAGWLAVGRHADRALLFTSADAAAWQKGPSLPGRGFPEAAAHGPDGYVAVGQHTRWAAAWHSTDLKKWTRGSGAGDGRMRDVTAVPDGYVAVGARPGDGADRPAAWTSTDGKKWTPVQIPTLPPGVKSGVLTRVAVNGDVLVALGSGRAGTPEQAYPFVAVSADGGKVWQTQALPGAAAAGTLTAVTATPKGYVVAGTAGTPGTKDVALWTSPDGRAWRTVPAHGTGLNGPGDQVLTALAVSGGALVAVGVTGDHRGETPTYWRTPLP